MRESRRQSQRLVWRRDLAFCLLLAGLTAGVFAQVRAFEFIQGDDARIVTANPAILDGLTWKSVLWAFTHFHFGLYMPVTSLSHLLDVELFGLWPGGHHLSSVVLHLLNAMLLYLVLLRMTGQPGQSAFVAAVFAIHPLRANSVVWVASRKDLSSALFFLLAILAYTRYVRKGGLLRYLPVAAATALALMAKPATVTLPCVLLLLDWWPLERLGRAGEAWRGQAKTLLRLIAEKLPLFALAVAAAYLAVRSESSLGQVASIETLPLRERAALSVVNYARYIVHSLAPWGLSVQYPYSAEAYRGWQVAAAVGALLGITAGVFALRRRRYLAVGWCWYLGMLAPVIGLFQFGNAAYAHRFTYLPQIGLWILVAWGVPAYVRSARGRTALHVAGVLVVGALAVLAWRHAGHWRNDDTLQWRDLEVTLPLDAAHGEFGARLFDKGRIPDAILQYREAARVNPANPRWPYDLGSALLAEGRHAEAVEALRAAVTRDPDFAEAQMNLGVALLNLRRCEEALVHFERRMGLPPDNIQARVNYGIALQQCGHLREAIEAFEVVLQEAPGHQAARSYLDTARAAMQRLPRPATAVAPSGE